MKWNRSKVVHASDRSIQRVGKGETLNKSTGRGRTSECGERVPSSIERFRLEVTQRKGCLAVDVVESAEMKIKERANTVASKDTLALASARSKGKAEEGCNLTKI
jgi:hypothetical protein